MLQDQELNIAFNKRKLIQLLLFSIAFFAAGLWIIIKDPTIGNSFFNNPVIKAIAGYGGVLLGVAGSFLFFKRILRNEPAIVLNNHGIIENISMFKFGLIPWNEIAGFQEQVFQAGPTAKQKFIAIYLKDAEKYIDQETNTLKKKLIKLNINNYGTPLYLPSNNLKIKQNELLSILQEYLNRNQQ